MKKWIIVLVLIVLASVLVSCRTKKHIVENTVTRTQYDTIIKERLVVKNSGIVDTTYITEPCDENGKLKTFHTKVSTANAKVEAKSNKGVIELYTRSLPTEDTRESILSIRDTKETSDVRDRTVIYKAPMWAWISVLFNVLMILLLTRKY